MNYDDLVLTPEEMLDAMFEWQKTMPISLPEITQTMRFEIIAKAQIEKLADLGYGIMEQCPHFGSGCANKNDCGYDEEQFPCYHDNDSGTIFRSLKDGG